MSANYEIEAKKLTEVCVINPEKFEEYVTTGAYSHDFGKTDVKGAIREIVHLFLLVPANWEKINGNYTNTKFLEGWGTFIENDSCHYYCIDDDFGKIIITPYDEFEYDVSQLTKPN